MSTSGGPMSTSGGYHEYSGVFSTSGGCIHGIPLCTEHPPMY